MGHAALFLPCSGPRPEDPVWTLGPRTPLGQLRSDLVKILHALSQLRHRETVFVFHRENRLDALAPHLSQNAFDVAAARSPRHVVRLHSVFVEVLDVEGNNASFQLLEGLDRLDVRAHPVSGVAAGTDSLAMALARLEYNVRIPVAGRPRMVVQGYVDLVLVAQLIQFIEGIERRFRDKRFDPHVLGEFEGCLVSRTDAEVYELEALVGQALLGLPPRFRRQAGADLLVGLFGAEFLIGISLDEMKTELGRLVHGFVEREAIERPGLAAQSPTEFFGMRRSLRLVGSPQSRPGQPEERGTGGDESCCSEKTPAVHILLPGPVVPRSMPTDNPCAKL